MDEVMLRKETMEFLLMIFYALGGSLAMGVSLGLLLRFFDRMTPIDEWKEIEKGNLAVAIILAAVIIAFGMVVSTAIRG